MTGTKDDRVKYCEAWAQMMVTIWKDKMTALGIGDTEELLKSFETEIQYQANGDVNKIVHSYVYYGRMVDMGVGGGISFDEVAASNRNPKQWKGDSYWRSVRVLSEKMAELYGENFLSLINESMNFTT